MAGFVAPIIQGLTVLREKQEKAAEEQAKQTLVNLLVAKFSDPTVLHNQLTQGEE